MILATGVEYLSWIALPIQRGIGGAIHDNLTLIAARSSARMASACRPFGIDVLTPGRPDGATRCVDLFDRIRFTHTGALPAGRE